MVSNSIGAIGYDPGSTGVVTVDGLDSKWMHSGDLYVGYSGTGTLSVQNGASVQAANLLVNNMSAIHGDGTITGNVKNDGLVAPGTSPGALSITGNYTQIVTGDLLLELASVSTYDQLLVTGNVDLDGTVQVTLLGGFMPVSGDSFNILDFGSFTDSSYSLMLPALATGLQWDTSQFEIAGEISVTRLGDHNFDDSVDAADYVAWRKFDGLQPGYDVWRTHFGESAGGGAGAAFGSPDAAVPEPGVVGLLALAVAGLRFVRCGRPKCTV